MERSRTWPLLLLLVAVAASAACKGKGDDKSAKNRPTPAVVDDLSAKVKQEISAWKNKVWERPPLVAKSASAGDCRAIDLYAKAFAEPDSDQRPTDAAGDLFSRPETWAEADAALRDYAASDAAAGIAKAILAGAACKDGTGLPMGDDISELPDFIEVLRATRIATSRALFLSAAGKQAEAAFLLIATIRMAHDAGNGGPLIGHMVGVAAQGLVLPSLLHVARELSAEEIAELVANFRLVVDSTPRFVDTWQSENVWQQQLLLTFMADSTEPTPDVDEILDKLLAKKTAPEVFAIKAAEMAALAGIDDRPFSEVPQLLDAALAPWAELSETAAPSTYLKYAAKARHGVAELRAHYIALAVLAEHKRSGAWPATLETLGDLPLDPISMKPFTYVQGKSISAATLDCGKVDDCSLGDLEPVAVILQP